VGLPTSKEATVSSQTSHDSQSADKSPIRALYHAILTASNRRSGDDFAAAFVEDGAVVGFEGAQIVGPRTFIKAL
jgi:hypothetical protein